MSKPSNWLPACLWFSHCIRRCILAWDVGLAPLSVVQSSPHVNVRLFMVSAWRHTTWHFCFITFTFSSVHLGEVVLGVLSLTRQSSVCVNSACRMDLVWLARNSRAWRSPWGWEYVWWGFWPVPVDKPVGDWRPNCWVLYNELRLCTTIFSAPIHQWGAEYLCCQTETVKCCCRARLPKVTTMCYERFSQAQLFHKESLWDGLSRHIRTYWVPNNCTYQGIRV